MQETMKYSETSQLAMEYEDNRLVKKYYRRNNHLVKKYYRRNYMKLLTVGNERFVS